MTIVIVGMPGQERDALEEKISFLLPCELRVCRPERVRVALCRHKVPVAFVMIEDTNTLHAARWIADQSPDTALVMICSSPDFALEGIRLHALDYLIHPVKDEDLQKAFLRVFGAA